MRTGISTRAGPEIAQRWREQIARHQRQRAAQGPRPLAAIGYQVQGKIVDGLTDVRRLLFVSLRDEREANGRLVTLVAGYKATAVPWGIQVGGPQQNPFAKDLRKAPAQGAHGRRFDLAHPDVLALALNLDQLLERHRQFPRMPRRRQPRWPMFWAAFSPRVACTLQGTGPEFEHCAGGLENGSADLFETNCRMIGGLVAFPLPFVSHAWQRFAAIYADLKTLPKRQVIELDRQSKNLRGFSQAVEFDLLHTRFATRETDAVQLAGHAGRS